jgi:hypothetical protein
MEKASKFRKVAVKLVMLSLMVCLFSSFNTIKRRDCNPLLLLDEALKRLKKFTLIKDYQFNFKEKKKKGEIEVLKQTITLNRGVRYKFLAVENPEYEGKAVVTIFNNEKQEILIASSYSASMQKFYDQIEFECKTTGNYCLSFYFKDGLEGCAVGVHSFLKD